MLTDFRSTEIPPSVVAPILKVPKPLRGNRSTREKGNDDRQVSRHPNHWVFSVRKTLEGLSWVDMYIGDDRYAARPTPVPEPAEARCMYYHGAGPTRVRVKIIVVNNLLNLPASFG